MDAEIKDTNDVNEQALALLLQQQAERRKALGGGDPKKVLWKMSIPSMISYMCQGVYVLIDSIFISQYSPLQAAATSYPAAIAIYIKQAFSTSIGLGASGLIAGAIGAKDYVKAEKSIAAVMHASLLVGILYPIIMLPSLDRLLPLLGCPKNIMHWAKEYSYITIGGTFLNCTAIAFSNVLRAQGYVKTAALSMIAGVIVNCIIDPSMIYGGDLGIEGSSVSILCGNFVTTLICLFPLIGVGKIKCPIRFRFKYFRKPTLLTFKIFYVGLGAFMGYFSNAIASSITNNLLTKTAGWSTASPEQADLLTESIAAPTGNAMLCMFVFFSISQGINSVFIPLASFAHSAGMYRRFKVLFKWALIWESSVMLFAGAILTAFAKWIPYIFYSGNAPIQVQFRKEMTNILYQTMPTRMLVGVTVIAFASFQAVNMQKTAGFLGAARQIICYIPVAYIYAYCFREPIRVVLAYPTSDLLAVILCGTLLIIYRKQLHLTKEADNTPISSDMAENETQEVAIDISE